MLRNSTAVGAAIPIAALLFALNAKSIIAQSSDSAFRADFTPDKGREPTITVRLFYLGEGSRTVFWPFNHDIKITSPGKWALLPPPSPGRVIVTGTGSFGTQPITKEEPIVGFMNLKDYITFVTKGKNVISFDFPVKLPDEKRVVTIRKELELELSDEQIAHFSEPGVH